MRPFHDVLSQVRHLADRGGVSDADLLRRFAAGGDDAAFELLVWRHGGLVLNTCRRILGGSDDAEDAFQATFLALVRKAGSIRDGRALVGWLHHVARRASLRALRSSRARRERTGLPDAAAVTTDEPAWREIGTVLEEEVARLPERMRVAFVLCQLEGQTAAEAAAQLGCPEGTVLSRLSRARQRLRERLTRRGLAPEPALPRAAPAAALVAATLRSAGRFAAGGSIPDPILSLTEGVLREMFLSKLKGAAAVLALVLFAGLGGVWAYAGQAGQRAAPRPAASERPRKEEPEPKKKPAAPIQLATLDKKLKHVDEVIASPDGRLVVTGGTRPSGFRPKDDLEVSLVLVWDSATGKLVHTIDSPVGSGVGMAFSPDGKTLATPNSGVGSVTLHAVGTWKVRRTLESHPLVSEVAFTRDGKTLASRSCAFAGPTVYSEVKLWDVATGRDRASLKRAEAEAFHSMAFSPDGRTLAVAASTGKVRLVVVATGKERDPLAALAKGTALAHFAPDGKTLATWAESGDPEDREARGVKLWDLATGKVRRTIELAKGAVVRHAAFSPDGKTLAIAGDGAALGLYDPATGKRRSELKLTDAAKAELDWLAFSPDGKTLAASGAESRDRSKPIRPVTRFFSLTDGRAAAAPERTRSVTFTPRGGKVVLIVGDQLGETNRRPDEVTVRDANGLVPVRKE